MVVLFITTTISCSKALSIIDRLSKVKGLTSQQKIEIVQVLREYIPTCPFTLVPDERPKLNPR